MILSLIHIFCRFVLAAVCGSVIGFERGKKRHAAGLRTHIVVCIGAMSAMLVNQYIVTYFNPNSDPARMGAQVISGIGFLGAGTIFISQKKIAGLTTAASLWNVACLGLAVGMGYYTISIAGCAIVIITLALLQRLVRVNSVKHVEIKFIHRVETLSLIHILTASPA